MLKLNNHYLTNNKLNWLYIDINSYFATIEQQVTPELRYKPIAIVPVITYTTCAIAASYEAKLRGVKTGTRIYEAKKLCHDLICIPARHELYYPADGSNLYLQVEKL
ncbi:MAG: hypothetical protein LN588_00380 [Rickettsia endosymbiont of Bryobia graminum]|nr:hypothetical protein [Rickettsia endosymbiont of Bryobia graminum]